MITEVTLYDFVWYFSIYSLLGWCLEVAYAAVSSGEFINRGFLNGPVCPIYGFGMVLVIASLTPLKGNILALFIGAVILTSALEWVTGFILEKLFNHKWWDYADMPFNICGYICLKFSIAWGLACLIVVDMIHPLITGSIYYIPHLLGEVWISIIVGLFLIDAAATIASILNLNKRLKQMDEIANKLKEGSNELGEIVSCDAIALKERYEAEKEEFMVRHAVEMQELKVKYEELAEKRKYIHNRMMKAFPDIKSNKYARELEELKKRYLYHMK